MIAYVWREKDAPPYLGIRLKVVRDELWTARITRALLRPLPGTTIFKVSSEGLPVGTSHTRANDIRVLLLGLKRRNTRCLPWFVAANGDSRQAVQCFIVDRQKRLSTRTVVALCSMKS